MTASLSKLITETDSFKKDVKESLELALKRDFVSVIVVGLDTEGNVHSHVSNMPSQLKMLGALEVAKEKILKDWQ